MGRLNSFGDYGSAPDTGRRSRVGIPVGPDDARDEQNWHDRSQAAKAQRLGGRAEPIPRPYATDTLVAEAQQQQQQADTGNTPKQREMTGWDHPGLKD